MCQRSITYKIAMSNNSLRINNSDVQIGGAEFRDSHRRVLLLRGINLGGSSKVPYQPNGATYLSKEFLNHRQVSFVNRPFPLEEADEHFARLRKWGFTLLRLIVTWEAIEHAGPGVYDQDYLDYLYAIVSKAAEHCINIIIDPHQDVWSRFSGGDGAPGWTLEAIGINIGNIHTTGAAFLHQFHEGLLPRMIWITNATKLVAATMFTLFFGGNSFAPKTKIDGEPIQEYLQRHYIAALKQVALRLKDLPNVIGYGVMNEPLCGYIGTLDLSKSATVVQVGAIPSPFQAMLLGEGISQEIGIWERRVAGPRLVEKGTLNPNGTRLWLEDNNCVWRVNGVWDFDRAGVPRLLQADYFSKNMDDKPVDFCQDHYLPFIRRYVEAIGSIHLGAIFCVDEEEVTRRIPLLDDPLDRVVYAPHWYDATVLFLKRFIPLFGYDEIADKIIIGSRSIRQSYKKQLARFKRIAIERMARAPVLVGETGIAFDLDAKKAYRTNNFRSQIRAMDRTLHAFDENLLSYMLWNYTSDNTNEHGDMWNDEDFSIFSRDQQDNPKDIYSGGRALEAIIRPYAKATAGEPLCMSFDIEKKVFEYTFRHDPTISEPTLIFVPEYQYPNGYDVKITDGSFEIDREEQTLIYQHSQDMEVHKVVVKSSKKYF